MALSGLQKLRQRIVTRIPKPASQWGRRFALGALVGVIAGLAAAALEAAIHYGTDRLVGRFAHLGSAQVFRFDLGVLLLPAIGCLVAGILAYLIFPGTRSHGVDSMTRAFHRNMGELPMRGPLTKAAGCSIVISSGGSAGPEGPMAALGAAIGSLIARIFPLSARERRILLIAGCAAAVGAIFRSPLGGALFATSILYREPEFESDAIVPSFVASVIGYSTFMLARGFEGPMLQGVSDLTFTSPVDLFWYALLGPLCGLVAIFFYFCINRVENGLIPKVRAIPIWVWPGIGGLATGAIACVLPQVMDSRFTFLQNALDGGLMEAAFSPWGWVWLFGAVVVAKAVATGLTVGSGAPGGVLGPSVFIGGALGAFVGALGQAVAPDLMSEPLRQALIPVGMAGVLAATMRIPLAAIVMVMEMTGSFGLIAPLMLVCVIAYIVGRKWGLNKEQVRNAADSPTHAADPIIHLLESWKVRDLAQRIWPMTVEPGAPIDTVISQLEPGIRPVIAVAKDGELKGIISPEQIGEVMQEQSASALLVAEEIMTQRFHTVDAEDDVASALSVFERAGADTLPIMQRATGTSKWIGMLTRKGIVDALQHRLRETHEAAYLEHPGLDVIRKTHGIEQFVMGAPTSHAEIQRLFVPMDAVGKSLREADFRNRYNAQVIAVEEADGKLQCPPNLDAPLRTNQRLLAVLWTEEASQEST